MYQRDAGEGSPAAPLPGLDLPPDARLVTIVAALLNNADGREVIVAADGDLAEHAVQRPAEQRTPQGGESTDDADGDPETGAERLAQAPS